MALAQRRENMGAGALRRARILIGQSFPSNRYSNNWLNRAPARLKDIKDLFLGTGAGTAAYSIIEQGRVDQILQGNPISRRAV